MRGQGVHETLTGVAKLVLKTLAERYGGGVVEEPPPIQLGGLPPAPPPPPVVQSTKPLEVEELSAGELLEEIDEIPQEGGTTNYAATPSHMPHNSVVEVPVVLDRSLFSGDGPIEIKLKLYIK
jgi:hypothetical protein